MSAFTEELERRDLLEVATEICKPFGLLVDELRTGPGHRSPGISEARARFALHLRGLGWSYPRIAKLLGYKHHDGVMYLLGTHKRRSGAKERREAKFANVVPLRPVEAEESGPVLPDGKKILA